MRKMLWWRRKSGLYHKAMSDAPADSKRRINIRRPDVMELVAAERLTRRRRFIFRNIYGRQDHSERRSFSEFALHVEVTA